VFGQLTRFCPADRKQRNFRKKIPDKMIINKNTNSPSFKLSLNIYILWGGNADASRRNSLSISERMSVL
jgi:hypothetical protein